MKVFDELKSTTVVGLTLKKPTDEDNAFIAALLIDPKIMEAQGGVWSESQIDAFMKFLVQHWKTHGFGHFVISYKHQNIGVASLKLLQTSNGSSYDIGFMVKPEFWNKGFATAAATRLAELAFNDLGIKKISALTLENQRAGVSVLEKLGFQKQNTTSLQYAGQTFENCIVWELHKPWR